METTALCLPSVGSQKAKSPEAAAKPAASSTASPVAAKPTTTTAATAAAKSPPAAGAATATSPTAAGASAEDVRIKHCLLLPFQKKSFVLGSTDARFRQCIWLIPFAAPCAFVTRRKRQRARRSLVRATKSLHVPPASVSHSRELPPVNNASCLAHSTVIMCACFI